MKRILFFLLTFCIVSPSVHAETLSGQIIDREHNLLKYFMETGARWNGKFDSITSPMVHITAYKEGARVGKANPQEDGSFEIKIRGGADQIVLSVPDGGYYLVEQGSWSSGDQVDLDIDSIPSFVISGVVLKKGAPASFQGVRALDAKGKTLTRVTSRKNGKFEVHVSVPVSRLKTYFSELEGPWDGDAEVELGE